MSQEVASQAPRFTRQAAPVKENRRFCLRKRIRKWYDIWCKFRFNVICIMCDMIEGSLEVKLPTILTDEKQSWSRRIEKRRAEERRSEKRKSQKKEDAGARKGRKVAKHCVFQMICGSGGSKSRLAKAAGAERSGQMRDEKLHAVVARSTFRSQNVQNTPFSDHFWRFRCRKSARRCGAKHISKSKLLKTPRIRTTFGRSDIVSRGKRKGLCALSEASKTWGFCYIPLHYTTLHSTTLHSTTLHSITLYYITLHYTTFHYTPLHYSQLHYTTLH